MKTTLERARVYLATLPPGISGQGGHGATFRAACWVARFGLGDGDALALLEEFNRRCQPPWSQKELLHKLRDARRVVARSAPRIPRRPPAQRTLWRVQISEPPPGGGGFRSQQKSDD